MVTYGPNIKFYITLKVCLPLFFPRSDIILSLTPSGRGGEVFLGVRGRGVSVLQILTLTKKLLFSTPVFRPGL